MRAHHLRSGQIAPTLIIYYFIQKSIFCGKLSHKAQMRWMKCRSHPAFCLFRTKQALEFAWFSTQKFFRVIRPRTLTSLPEMSMTCQRRSYSSLFRKRDVQKNGILEISDPMCYNKATAKQSRKLQIPRIGTPRNSRTAAIHER